MKTRIMYIENKSAGDGLEGLARIGRIRFSKTGRSMYYGDLLFQSLGGMGGLKSNYLEVNSGNEYWISGCKKSGGDRLYSGEIEIDDDIREEYWTDIRKAPEHKNQTMIKCRLKY